MLLASTPKLLRDDVNSAQLFPSLSSSFATTASTSSMRALLPAVISWVPPKFSASSVLRAGVVVGGRGGLGGRLVSRSGQLVAANTM